MAVHLVDRGYWHRDSAANTGDMGDCDMVAHIEWCYGLVKLFRRKKLQSQGDQRSGATRD